MYKSMKIPANDKVSHGLVAASVQQQDLSNCESLVSVHPNPLKL